LDSNVETLIHHYYACYNQRRFAEAASLFADDALIEHLPLGRQHRGPEGYLRFAEAWNAAFPDGRLTIDRIEGRSDCLYDVHVVSLGTHRGLLDIGTFQFKPTGAEATLRLRELLKIHDGRITASTLSIDLNDLVNQLSAVNYKELGIRLERIRQLTDELHRAAGDAERQADVAVRLGFELDAARHALRPHYKRSAG
jgi:predicted ester cyclase